MSEKVKEYLFGFAPLLFPSLVLPFLKIEFPSIALFVVAYVWHLFLIFPDTEAQMTLRHYRFAFVRFIYLFFFKLNKWINRKNYFVIESLLRALGPLTFFYGFDYFYGGINFYFLLLGSAYFEACYFSRKIFFPSKAAPDSQKTL